MHSILLPVDGSEQSLRAVKHAISSIKEGLAADIHVINVQPPIVMLSELPVVDYEQVEQSQRELGQNELLPACQLLDNAGLHYTQHLEIGPISRAIVQCAKANSCDSIIMGTRGRGTFGSWLLGSTANAVVHLAEVPVTLVK
ncbi:MAG TPA: universal stress protein [Methylophilaceae bacterium]|nr:universal stress protein [Methylophilaceae bacterium]